MSTPFRRLRNLGVAGSTPPWSRWRTSYYRVGRTLSLRKLLIVSQSLPLTRAILTRTINPSHPLFIIIYIFTITESHEKILRLNILWNIIILTNELHGHEYVRPLYGAGVLWIARSAKVETKNCDLRIIGTRNVNSMHEPGKIHNTV